jgi:hypothetical protein
MTEVSNILNQLETGELSANSLVTNFRTVTFW